MKNGALGPGFIGDLSCCGRGCILIYAFWQGASAPRTPHWRLRRMMVPHHDHQANSEIWKSQNWKLFFREFSNLCIRKLPKKIIDEAGGISFSRRIRWGLQRKIRSWVLKKTWFSVIFLNIWNPWNFEKLVFGSDFLGIFEFMYTKVVEKNYQRSWWYQFFERNPMGITEKN